MYRSGLTPMLILITIRIQLTALIQQMPQIRMHILNSQLKTAKYHLGIVSRNHQVTEFRNKYGGYPEMAEKVIEGAVDT